jgi:hypothetical protein
MAGEHFIERHIERGGVRHEVVEKLERWKKHGSQSM